MVLINLTSHPGISGPSCFPVLSPASSFPGYFTKHGPRVLLVPGPVFQVPGLKQLVCPFS